MHHSTLAIDSLCSRRKFTALAAGAVSFSLLKPSSAIEPFARPKPGKLRLSLAAYSLRDFLTKENSGWDLFKFVEYCRDLGIPGAELTSYYFPKDVTNEYLVELKQHCHRLGITISGGAIRNDYCQQDPSKLNADIEHTKLWIDRYAVLGAPVIRIFAGNQPKDEQWQTTLQRCVSTCETVSSYAAAKGVYLGIENHGGVTAKAEGLLDIVKKVNAKSFGINLDSGNFRSTGNPYAELEMIAPYAVNAQLKVDIYPGGKHEVTDVPRVLKLLSDAGYNGWVALEYENSAPPLEAIPKWIEILKREIANGKYDQ